MNVYLQWGHVFANWLYKEEPTEDEKILAGGAHLNKQCFKTPPLHFIE